MAQYGCKFDGSKYINELSKRMAVSTKHIATKTRNFLVSFAYTFPKDDASVKDLNLQDGVEAFAALGEFRRGWHDFRKKSNCVSEEW